MGTVGIVTAIGQGLVVTVGPPLESTDQSARETGHISTSEDDYLIEPAEKSSGDYPLSSFLHRIKKVPHTGSPGGNDVVGGESEQCETNDCEAPLEKKKQTVAGSLPVRAAGGRHVPGVAVA
ncbi:hypothetical protein GEV33_015196 [Tenebrio molitor]|uniref:Uncharacterized protein n=1 Tax=Tenebrio molitor TaxID=7067 RepID=A0A8J6GWV3_TENMO|nr:hypothetical protein GEV33_015198 [Tenebrio molitor]KAH0807595.1 hypothetical protein GEV33_015196 [Tenebrio molitor]